MKVGFVTDIQRQSFFVNEMPVPDVDDRQPGIVTLDGDLYRCNSGKTFKLGKVRHQAGDKQF